MEAYATKFEKAIYLNGCYLVLFSGNEYGLYAKGKSRFRNKFRTCLLASGTKDELEDWAKRKLFTRKELVDAYQEGKKSGTVSTENDREIKASTPTSSGRTSGQASDRLQRNKSRCSVFLRWLPSKRSG